MCLLPDISGLDTDCRDFVSLRQPPTRSTNSRGTHIRFTLCSCLSAHLGYKLSSPAPRTPLNLSPSRIHTYTSPHPHPSILSSARLLHFSHPLTPCSLHFELQLLTHTSLDHRNRYPTSLQLKSSRHPHVLPPCRPRMALS